MAVDIRPARHDDVADIQSVAERAWHAAHAPIIGPESVDEFLAEYYDTESFESRIDDESIILDVAVVAGSRVDGYVMAHPIEDEDGNGGEEEKEEETRTFNLGQIYVDPDRWGEGVGSALLDHVEAAVARRGGDRIKLGVMAENDRAVEFYESAGYRQVDEFYDERIDTRGYTYLKLL